MNDPIEVTIQGEYDKIVRARMWCLENFGKENEHGNNYWWVSSYYHGVFKFRNPEDASMFKLKWG